MKLVLAVVFVLAACTVEVNSQNVTIQRCSRCRTQHWARSPAGELREDLNSNHLKSNIWHKYNASVHNINHYNYVNNVYSIRYIILYNYTSIKTDRFALVYCNADCSKFSRFTSPLPPPLLSSYTVRSGQQVAIKMPYRNHWLGCAGHTCSAAGCPGRFFSTSKSRCWGEKFTIYSKHARGRPIKVGDQVGLYFNRHKKWFGCPHHRCCKYPCPGRPSYHYGFQHPSYWHRCAGEVFTIYAMGKCNGQTINHKDAIMLRYKNKWVSLWAGKADKRTCPGYLVPPPTNKYDQCAGEAFEIFKI